MREPTAEQCDANALLREDENHLYYAMWYPQMGGYVGKAEVQIAKDGSEDGCFEVRVWHDGEFPFDEDTRPGVGPAHLHHCAPSQFIDFGQKVMELQESPRANLTTKQDPQDPAQR